MLLCRPGISNDCSLSTILASALILCLLLPSLAMAKTEGVKFQSHDSIREAVTSWVLDEAGDNTEIKRISLDTRLKLRQCEMPINTFWPPGARGSSSASVGVACEGERPWKIFVPVKLLVTKPVLVASRSLMRGDILDEADVMMVEKDVSRLNGNYLTDIGSFIGFEIRQQIKEERVIRANMFKAPRLVKRGDTVTIVAGTNGFEVRVGGTALGGGGKGKRISVRNLKSKRVVQAEVIRKGLVRVF